MKKISVVIPIYNEENVLEELYSRLESVLFRLGNDYEIIFVNDASTDRSLEILRRIYSRAAKVTVIELTRNYGQTAALAAGIDDARGDIIVTMDGDLQHSPEDIPRFFDKLEEGYDVVSGWREKRDDHLFFRRIPSLLANWLMRCSTGVYIRDFGSGFKAYRAEVLKQVELFGELHRFIPVLASRVGARIVEIPIIVHVREKGKSKYGPSRTMGIFQDLIFLNFYSNYLTKPIRAFGWFFLLFFSLGAFIFCLSLFLRFTGSINAIWNQGILLLLSVFLMSVGIQFLAMGVLAELLSRIHLHTSHSKIYSVRQTYKKELQIPVREPSIGSSV